MLNRVQIMGITFLFLVVMFVLNNVYEKKYTTMVEANNQLESEAKNLQNYEKRWKNKQETSLFVQKLISIQSPTSNESTHESVSLYYEKLEASAFKRIMQTLMHTRVKIDSLKVDKQADAYALSLRLRK